GARPLPVVPACGIGWGVCPEHGATLTAEADGHTRCAHCNRRWPDDRLNLPCPEPITRTEEARHLMRTGMCSGHAVALAAVYGIETEPLRPGRPVPEAGTWDHGREAGRYVRDHYRLPAAKRHARITVDGRSGTILGFRGGYLLVRFDADPDRRVLCHPIAGVSYPASGQPGPALTAGRPVRRHDGGRP
ncbi:hypothetical protein, partial [Nonomuraea sp. NPDC049784]|uniref:hypothetical protein n=1 Tax=Nonomuraea sp. NPDC049784 TaxID=3154361 RepID=UPI0033D76BE6